jgi:cytochrome c oxidase subunit I+III
MPRRVFTYSPDLGVSTLNLITSVFAFVLAAGVLVALVDVVLHVRSGRLEGDKPWGAPSLEWMAGLKEHGFRSIVPITSRYPVWEQKDLAEEESSGRGYLPDTPTGAREALLTSPVASEPDQILRLPGPGWVAFVAAVASAIGMGAMTLKLSAAGLVAGLVAAGAFLYWLWTMDAALPRGLADAGRGLALPLYTNGSGSVGWWAAIVALVADAAVFASFIFAYLFLWTARPATWIPEGARLPEFLQPALAGACVVAAYILFEGADRLNQRRHRTVTSACLVAAAILAAIALAIGWIWLRGLGADPTAHSYGAAVWTLLGYGALHVAIGGVMALWCVARIALGMLDSWRCLTLRICLLFWRFTVLATLITLLLVAVWPHVAS